MYQYSVVQWLFFFYLYCFMGWCFESVYVSICQKKIINRGFMRGPFLPIYGSGAIVMLVVSAPYQGNIILTYLSGVIGATLLEYVTGVCMEALFKVRYWDYSKKPFNFQGHICLGSSIAWGFLTIFMTHVVHRPIAEFVLGIPSALLTIITLTLTVFIAADFSISFRTAMDLRDVLMRMEKGKEELLRIQKRLDVMIAVIDESKEEFVEGIEQKKEQTREQLEQVKEKWKETIQENLQYHSIESAEMKAGIEEQLNKVKRAIYERPSKYLESIRDEVSELRGRFSVQSDDGVQKAASDFHKRNLILGNPSMASARYNEYLEELKKEITRRKQSRKKKTVNEAENKEI
ncbi:MAG: hypothetical protein PHE02_04640 [Lachnospiraceae bacterium]|nr:hypothetical protein [Lachnospiraceae bacterium]